MLPRTSERVTVPSMSLMTSLELGSQLKERDEARAVAAVLEATGCINGLVNVAGITRDARIAKTLTSRGEIHT